MITKAQETEKLFIWLIHGGFVPCDFLVGYLARDQFLSRLNSFLCKQDSKMLHEQQPGSNRPTIIENFGEN